MIFILLLANMSVFESPQCPSTRMERDQAYSISSPDVREYTLDDMMHRIHPQSDNPDYYEQESERDQLQQLADSFIQAMGTPGRRIGLDPIPDVHTCNTSTPVSQLCQLQMSTINLTFRTLKLQHHPSGRIMRIFLRSCMHIFDSPMVHITNGKVKTNIFLIWAGPNEEDVYKNLQLSPSQQYNLNAVFEAFKRYCKPICDFHAARFKFRAVKQHESGTINTFYH